MPRSILSFDLLETLMIKTGIFPLQSPSTNVVGETAASLLRGGFGEMGNRQQLEMFLIRARLLQDSCLFSAGL